MTSILEVVYVVLHIQIELGKEEVKNIVEIVDFGIRDDVKQIVFGCQICYLEFELPHINQVLIGNILGVVVLLSTAALLGELEFLEEVESLDSLLDQIVLSLSLTRETLSVPCHELPHHIIGNINILVMLCLDFIGEVVVRVV